MKNQTDRNKNVNTTLPIIFVIDTSGGMHGRPINILNNCLSDSIKTLSDSAALDDEFPPAIGILQAHTNAHWIHPDGLVSLKKFDYTPLTAGGLNDMGAAMTELDKKLSREAFLESTAEKCHPIIIFVTRRQITDNWSDAFQKLNENRWYKQSIKIAFVIDEMADVIAFSNIVGKTGIVIKVEDYNDLSKIFKNVVINCFKNCQYYHSITDLAEKPEICRDIVRTVLIDTELESQDKITVIYGSNEEPSEYIAEFTEKDKHSTIDEIGRIKRMKKIITDSREIEVTVNPISILRCEIEACLPDNSHEQCFLLKPRKSSEHDNSETLTDILDVNNVGYGDVSVTYQIKNYRSFDIPSQKQMKIEGCLELSFMDNRIIANAISDSKLTLLYSTGDYFELKPGDEIKSDKKTLMRYYSESDLWEWGGEDWT